RGAGGGRDRGRAHAVRPRRRAGDRGGAGGADRPARAMIGIWVVVAVLFAGTVALRAVGPVAFGARELSPRAAAVIGLVAPALLAALVVYETLTPGRTGVAVDARVAGLAAAGAAIALRAPMLVVVIVAAATTAGVRALA